ncbi:MAG: hypothetical protein IJT03_02610 [Clostridia bacterium]|nr:hypothetical protein [Clostridia bacterium]
MKNIFEEMMEQYRSTSEEETMRYVLNGMRETLGNDVPDAEKVKTYLLGKSTNLTPEEQYIATDKLLEWAEVNVRTICDLIRYKTLKRLGAVSSVDEFLRLFKP